MNLRALALAGLLVGLGAPPVAAQGDPRDPDLEENEDESNPGDEAEPLDESSPSRDGNPREEVRPASSGPASRPVPRPPVRTPVPRPGGAEPAPVTPPPAVRRARSLSPILIGGVVAFLGILGGVLIGRRR